MQKTILLSLIVSMLLLAGAANAYSTHIYDPAVINNGTSGQLTTIILNVTHGNGAITISGPASVASSTIQSAKTGVAYAAQYLGVNENSYNFSYYINDNNSAVSGPSAGLSFTLLAISGLEQKPLLDNFAVTGTISANGTVGLIGGVFNKASASKESGKQYLIVPYTPNSSIEAMFYYASQQNLGISLIEVQNVSQALQYVFGHETPKPMQLNYSQDYNVSTLPQVNQSCNLCNISDFYPLENYTINATASEINSMGSNFTSLKQQMLSVLNAYSSIGEKGYLYTASDFAFNEYIDAFMIANTNNASLQNAPVTINNIQDYCDALSAPQMTNKNYEYVIGGEFRQALANQTLSTAMQGLNVSTSSDGVILSLRSAGMAYAWCKAASQMYGIAYSLGGTNVTYNNSIRGIADNYLAQATSSSMPNVYLSIASSSFKNGNYYMTIYGSIYSEIFNANPYQTSNASMAQAAFNNATKQQTGIWAKEFAIQSAFFLNQANSITDAGIKSNYFTSAYSAALLSSALSKANTQISSNFVNYTAAYAPGAAGIQDQLNEIFGMLTVIFIMLVLIFIILLKNEIKARPKPDVKRKPVNRRRR